MIEFWTHIIPPILMISMSVSYVICSIRRSHKELEEHRRVMDDLTRNFPELLQRMASSNNREKVDWKKEGF